MNLKFLVDQNISNKTTEFLRNLGLNARDTKDTGLNGKSDEEIYTYAKKERSVIITFDHEFAYNFMNRKDLVGLIIIRTHPQTLEIVNNLLKSFFDKIKENDIIGNIIIAEKGRFRIRKVND